MGFISSVVILSLIAVAGSSEAERFGLADSETIGRPSDTDELVSW